jgi:putative ABC transport system permease protein
MVPVARRNLIAEKGRLAMSVAGVAFALLLVLIIVSLYRGWSESSSIFAELPGNLWVAQEGTTEPFRSSSLIPVGRLEELRRIDGVQSAIPVYARRVGFRHAGRDLDLYLMSLVVPAASVPASLRERFVPAPGHIVIESVFARKAGLSEGDAIDVLGYRLVVERITPGGNPLFELGFLNGADAPSILGLDAYVNFFLLQTLPGADVARVAAAARTAVPDSEIRTSKQFAASMSRLVNQGFLPVVGVLVGIGLVIGGAVIALTTYTATIEKARDFGVLKAVGASNRFVYRIVGRAEPDRGRARLLDRSPRLGARCDADQARRARVRHAAALERRPRPVRGRRRGLRPRGLGTCTADQRHRPRDGVPCLTPVRSCGSRA